VAGVGGDRAWAIRRAARLTAPVPALASLMGLSDDKSWHWRERALARAPKPVLSTIAGIDEERAWMMRLAAAPRCREALDSMIGLDHPVGWEIRESSLDLWPASVIKSLGVLVSGQRGGELMRRALGTCQRGISLLKQAALVATGANLNPTVLAA
jgi:dTMP kinase